ncbi:uncharacterized protein N7446_004167 [Penicillium canescens]|uniref:uncharacterized protein n=1 Tax=Penicillium canescens TaxID=5083 RepID=UPI0026E0BAAD|nr:uncharacterized protein N7446_004167 [Penicillium canescens]KAJ6067130.1 hypothetical protein N7446_004167 [Penicillium canescens]
MTILQPGHMKKMSSCFEISLNSDHQLQRASRLSKWIQGLPGEAGLSRPTDPQMSRPIDRKAVKLREENVNNSPEVPSVSLTGATSLTIVDLLVQISNALRRTKASPSGGLALKPELGFILAEGKVEAAILCLTSAVATLAAGTCAPLAGIVDGGVVVVTPFLAAGAASLDEILVFNGRGRGNAHCKEGSEKVRKLHIGVVGRQWF